MKTIFIVGGAILVGLGAAIGAIAVFAGNHESPDEGDEIESEDVDEVDEVDEVNEVEVETENKESVIPMLEGPANEGSLPVAPPTPKIKNIPGNNYPSDRRVAAERLKRKFNPKA